MKIEFGKIEDLKGKIKIPARELLKDFESIDLLYLHYTLTSKDWVDELLGVFSPEIRTYGAFIDLFEKRDARSVIKKIPRADLINDLINKISINEYLDIESILGIKENELEIYLELKSILMNEIESTMPTDNYEDVLGILKERGTIKSYIQLLMFIGRLNTRLNAREFKKLLNENSEYIINKYLEICEEYVEENKLLNRKINNLENIWLSKIEDKEARNQKLKEINKKLSKEVSEFKKKEKANEVNNVQEQSLDALEIRKMFNTIMESQKRSFEDVMNMKNTLSVASYENQIDKLNTIVSDLRVSSALKSKELKEALNKVEALKNEVDRLNALLNSNTVNLEAAVDMLEENEIIKPVKDEVKESLIPEIYIGYVKIENGQHYVIDSKNRKNKLEKIKENTYIPNNQFVLVNKNHEFLYSSTSFYDEIFEFNNIKLGIVVDTDPIKIEINGKIDKVQYNPQIILKKGQTVVVKNDFIIKPFKTQKLNLDHLLEPIKLQGQEVYYVLGYFGNKLAVRDIEFGTEDALEFDRNGYSDIKVKDIICVKDDKVVNVVPSKYWYTNSSYYKDKIQFGVVEKDGDNIFVNKQNGEKCMVGDIPPRVLDKMKDGEVIALDEYNDYICVVDTESSYIDRPVYTSSKKSASQMFETLDKEAFDKSKCKGKVAVIGSYKARESYINEFRKNGYDVQFIYGYEKNLSRVKREFKGCEAIICDPSHLGHSIQDAIKEKNFVPDGVLFGFAEGHGKLAAYEEFQRLKSNK